MDEKAQQFLQTNEQDICIEDRVTDKEPTCDASHQQGKLEGNAAPPNGLLDHFARTPTTSWRENRMLA
ncbi:MAG TPA: hypothetical protein VH110_00935 [Candidatus Acidoferrum sp.]|jgi:hypothetical protein|nr:hypothetical protein [Candidatus Acidoferrum sp.]